MKKEILYEYLGENGTILSPVLLPDVYHVIKAKLTAAPGKYLTKDGLKRVCTIIVPEKEANEWHEVF